MGNIVSSLKFFTEGCGEEHFCKKALSRPLFYTTFLFPFPVYGSMSLEGKVV